MAARKNIVIPKGATFIHKLRLEAPPIVYKPITAITLGAPTEVQCPGHGLVEGWRTALVSIKGPTALNAPNNPPKTRDYLRASVIDDDTLSYNTLNSSGLEPYISGGYVQYNTPIDMTGMTVKMIITDEAEQEIYASTEVVDDPLDVIDSEVDNMAKVITLTIPEDFISKITWETAFYRIFTIVGTITNALTFGSVVVGEN